MRRSALISETRCRKQTPPRRAQPGDEAARISPRRGFRATVSFTADLTCACACSVPPPAAASRSGTAAAPTAAAFARECAAAAAAPGIGRGQRRRQSLVLAQRLARRARADRSRRRAAGRARRATARSAGVVLTNGDLDHCLGLFSLRESQPLLVYATDARPSGLRARATRSAARSNASRGSSPGARLEPDAAQPLRDSAGGPSGLSVEAVAAPGKLPLHLEGSVPPIARGQRGARRSATSTAGERWSTFPAVAALTRRARRRAARGRLRVLRRHVLVERRARRGSASATARAEDMAHWPVGGAGRQPARSSRSLPAARKLYIHINNTNPLLRERLARARRGRSAPASEVAHDGMELEP